MDTCIEDRQIVGLTFLLLEFAGINVEGLKLEVCRFPCVGSPSFTLYSERKFYSFSLPKRLLLRAGYWRLSRALKGHVQRAIASMALPAAAKPDGD